MPLTKKMMKKTLPHLPRTTASTHAPQRFAARASTRGFTLLEVLVTLTLMMIMLGIIFIPLNSAFNIFQVGQSRNDLQLASRQTFSQLEKDIHDAVYIFPNSTMPGITDKAPFNGAPPYISGTCAGGTRVSNTSRLDLLLPLRRNEVNPTPTPLPDGSRVSSGSVVSPVRPAYYVVTYYVRRTDTTKNFDPFTNPLQLFRAKMPYKNSDGSNFEVSMNKKNIEVSGSRYDTANADCDDVSRWLRQDTSTNEPLDLEYIDPTKPNGKTRDASSLSPTIVGSHDLVSPRDLGFLPGKEDGSDLRPVNTNFICEDTNADGKIDRVTASLTLVQYDLSSVGGSSNGTPTYQQYTQTETVNAANVR